MNEINMPGNTDLEFFLGYFWKHIYLFAESDCEILDEASNKKF